MPIIEIEWLPSALEDLSRLYEFIKPHNPTVATQAVQLIILRANQLKTQPEMGKVYSVNKKFRELLIPFGRNQYVLRYRNNRDKIIIARIWHGKELRDQ